jgi:hypothetical protein
MNIGDKVLATFPSGWILGGTVLMVMGKEIDVQFLDGCHQAFLVENVEPVAVSLNGWNQIDVDFV